jgi:hypothetical protein
MLPSICKCFFREKYTLGEAPEAVVLHPGIELWVGVLWPMAFATAS